MYRDNENAFHRRINRDLDYMPKFMKTMFLLESALLKYSIFFVLSLIFLGGYHLFFTIDGTWLTGGDALLSDTNHIFYSSAFLFFGFGFEFVVSVLCQSTNHYWYNRVRKSFKRINNNSMQGI